MNPLERSYRLVSRLALLLCLAQGANAQTEPAPTASLVAENGTATAPNPYRGATDRLERHFEPSYLTAGGGINRTNTIDWGDLFYEAQVYVHYTWFDTAYGESPPDGDYHLRVVLPIRLQVRQYRSDSSPVKTPSYNPGIRVYLTRTAWTNAERMFYLSTGFHHYSNGQSGPHYNSDGTINIENGSFSSDYAELSCYWDRRRAWTKLNLRTYLVSKHFTWEPEQSHYYERGMAEITWRYDFRGEFRKPSNPQRDPGLAVQLTGAYKYGRDYIKPGVNAGFKDNFQWTAEALVPGQMIRYRWQWKDVRFYVRYDRGYDYYNIHYQERMDRVQFGIVASNY